MKKLVSLNRDLVVDLLTERLDFERTGVAIYEAVLRRIRASDDALVTRAAEKLAKIRYEEDEHANWLHDELHRLGARVDAQTPRSRLSGVESEGVIRIVLDPTRPIDHVFHAILVAELADHAGWNTLLNLAAEVQDDGAQERFREFIDHENEHLHTIRTIALALARRELTGIDTDVSRKAA